MHKLLLQILLEKAKDEIKHDSVQFKYVNDFCDSLEKGKFFLSCPMRDMEMKF